MIVVDLLFAHTINTFHSAHFLLNTSSSFIQALFCPRLWEWCSIFSAEGWADMWRGLCQPQLSRGDAAGSLHLPWDLAQPWAQASFHITVPWMTGLWKVRSWTSEQLPTERGSRSWTAIEGLASQACQLLLSFLALPCLCSTCPQQIHIHTHKESYDLGQRDGHF